MFHFDGKLILIGVLFLALVLIKRLAGGRPFDTPVRRPRRFGYRGVQGALNAPGARERPPEPEPQETPEQIEDDFFKSS